MIFLLTQDENGNYEKDGIRYSLLVCSWARGPRASDFVQFDSLQQVIEKLGLIEVNKN